MFEILKSMMKEEWRAHSTMFGGLMFLLFPILILLFSFIGSLFIPLFTLLLPFSQMVLLAHYFFVLFGLSVGAFGLLSREVMNRRFGQASMIAYSSRTLPVSERSIFLNFFIKDIIYYFILWILPFVIGFAIASPIISMNISYSETLLLTLSLSFLIGLSLSFIFSTIFVHSKRLLAGILFLVAVLSFLAANYFHITLIGLLPPLSFFFEPSASKIIISLAVITTLSALSIFFLKVDFPESKKRFKNYFDILTNKFKFSRYSSFVTKDFLDLTRSEGGPGKIIFSFLFPLAIIWLMLSVFLKIVPATNLIMTFSVFLGVVSSSMYNWLTEFDLFTSYSFLPVKISTVMKSKINSYLLLNIVSLLILIFVALVGNNLNYILPAILTFVTISLYSLAVTMYLTGLYPNLLLYNAKIMFLYTLCICPVLLISIFLSILNPFFLLASPILVLPSFYLIRKTFSKWDRWEHPTF